MRELGVCRGTMCQIKHSLFPCRFFRFILRLSSPGFVVATALVVVVKRVAASRFNANNDCDNNGLRN